jgi:hypothetical protein
MLMNDLLLQFTCNVISAINFLNVNIAYEMTTIDKNNGSIFYGSALLCSLNKLVYVSPIQTQFCGLIEGFTSSYVCLFLAHLISTLSFKIYVKCS